MHSSRRAKPGLPSVIGKHRQFPFSYATVTVFIIVFICFIRTPIKVFLLPNSLRKASHASFETPQQPEHPPLTRGEPGKCLKYVLYDKPVKTGSTAIMFAIRQYLNETSRRDKACGSSGDLSCVERAKAVCNGTVTGDERYSIIGHLKFGGKELVNCLRPDYYVATSIRDPYQRRKSAYLWNRTLNASHFNIPHTVTFSEFMERMPRCQLYNYYDGRGNHCDIGVSVEQRLQEIVDRVDEVIDIYDEPVGPLHRLMHKYMAKENESIKVSEDEYIEEFDQDTLKEEKMLYDRLREIRLRKPNPDRLPC